MSKGIVNSHVIERQDDRVAYNPASVGSSALFAVRQQLAALVGVGAVRIRRGRAALGLGRLGVARDHVSADATDDDDGRATHGGAAGDVSIGHQRS